MIIALRRFPSSTSQKTAGSSPSALMAAKRRGWASKLIRTTRGRVMTSPAAAIWAAQPALLLSAEHSKARRKFWMKDERNE